MADSPLDTAIKLCDGHLGDLVTWSIRGGVSPAELRDRAKATGFPAAFLPPTPSRKTVVRREILRVAKAAGLTATVISNQPWAIAWEITLAGELVDRVAFLRVATGGQPAGSIVPAEGSSFAQLVRDAVDTSADLLTGVEIVKCILRALKAWKATPLPGRGLYFLDAGRAKDVRALRDTIAGLNGSEFIVIPLPQVHEAKLAVGAYHFVKTAPEQREDETSTCDTCAALGHTTCVPLEHRDAEETRNDDDGIPDGPVPPAPPVLPKRNGDPERWTVKRRRQELGKLGQPYQGLSKAQLVDAYHEATG